MEISAGFIHVFLALTTLELLQTTRYDGYQVLQVTPLTLQNEKEVLQIIQRHDLSIWKRQRDGRSIDIQVSPNTIDVVTRELQDVNTPYSRWIQNIQSLIDEQQIEKYEKANDFKNPGQMFSLSRYNTFEEISAFIHSLTRTSFSGPSGEGILVDHIVIGQTYEENPIHLIKISKPGSQKKAIFLESGIHAREWIAPAVALYIIHQLSYNPSRSTAVEQLVADFDWYIVPVLNPDGYVYTHNKDRLWRKNRRQPSFGNNLTDICHGVDLNRNFGYKWGEGTSTDQCTATYSGPSPFSEPETLAVKRVLENKNINFLLYISFHSYGQYWMYPWGYTSTYTKDVKLLEFGAKIAVEALRQKYNTDYTVGSVYNALSGFIHVFLALTTLELLQTTRYDGYQVLQVTPLTLQNEKEVLQIIQRHDLSIWKRQRDGRSIDIQVSPNTIDVVTRELQDVNTPYSRWIQNIQSLIDEQQIEKYEKANDFKNPGQMFSLSRYNTFEEISAFIHSLTRTSFSGPSGEGILVDHIVIGQTYEENPIHLIKISKPGSQKKAIFLESGIHAREWIAPAVALYIIHQLSYNPSRSTAVEQLVADFDWYIVPVLNPDGYVYTHNKDRLWRKNRRQPSFGNNLTDICHGVDLNRNFGYKWGEGTSTDQCTATYSGPSPFSEPETLAVKRVLENKNINFLLYISFHSYGQYWMYPWGYTSTYTKDVKLLEFGAKIAVEALRQKYNTDYTVGSVYNALYAAEGVSLDYAKGQAGIKYCYTVELRDKDQYGFLLPQNQITPTCEETMDGIMTLVDYIKALETK